MESLVFHLNYSENTGIDVWNDVHAGVKQHFRRGSIKVLIEPEADFMTPLTLAEVIEQNERAGVEYVVPYADFSKIVAQLEADENFDAIGEILTYKQEKV
jgi:predicted nucleic acid-binding protein